LKTGQKFGCALGNRSKSVKLSDAFTVFKSIRLGGGCLTQGWGKANKPAAAGRGLFQELPLFSGSLLPLLLGGRSSLVADLLFKRSETDQASDGSVPKWLAGEAR